MRTCQPLRKDAVPTPPDANPKNADGGGGKAPATTPIDGLLSAALPRVEEAADVSVPRLAAEWRYRHQLEDEVAEHFEDVDVLLTPTVAAAAFPAEGPIPVEVVETSEGLRARAAPLTMLGDTRPAAPLQASVPAGTNAAGLPVGLQIIGRQHADEVVLRLSRLWEQERPWPRLAAA